MPYRRISLQPDTYIIDDGLNPIAEGLFKAAGSLAQAQMQSRQNEIQALQWGQERNDRALARQDMLAQQKNEMDLRNREFGIREEQANRQNTAQDWSMALEQARAGGPADPGMLARHPEWEMPLNAERANAASTRATHARMTDAQIKDIEAQATERTQRGAGFLADKLAHGIKEVGGMFGYGDSAHRGPDPEEVKREHIRQGFSKALANLEKRVPPYTTNKWSGKTEPNLEFRKQYDTLLGGFESGYGDDPELAKYFSAIRGQSPQTPPPAASTGGTVPLGAALTPDQTAARAAPSVFQNPEPRSWAGQMFASVNPFANDTATSGLAMGPREFNAAQAQSQAQAQHDQLFQMLRVARPEDIHPTLWANDPAKEQALHNYISALAAEAAKGGPDSEAINARLLAIRSRLSAGLPAMGQ